MDSGLKIYCQIDGFNDTCQNDHLENQIHRYVKLDLSGLIIMSFEYAFKKNLVKIFDSNHLSDKMIIYYLVVPCGYSSINAGTCTCRWDRTYTWWKITHPWNNIQWSACTQTKISSFPGDQFTPEVIELVHWPNQRT